MVKLANEVILDYFNNCEKTISFVLDESFSVIKSNIAFNKIFSPNDTPLSENPVIIELPEATCERLLNNKSLAEKLEISLYSTLREKEIFLDLEIKLWEQDNLHFYHCLGRDVTHLKNTLLEVEKYKQVAEKISSGVIIADSFGKTTWVNEGFIKKTGYTLSDIKGKKPGDLLQGKKTDKEVVKKMGKAIRNAEPFNVEVLNYHKNGKEIWLSVMCDPIKDAQSNLQGFIAVQPEITERKLRELELLSKKHDRFQAIFENTINAFILANNDMVCIDVNPAACRMLGFTKEELLGKSISEFTGKVKSVELWKDFVREGVQQGEIELIRKDKKRKKARYYAVTNVWENTHLSVLLDVTEQEQMQEMLKEKNKELTKINNEKNKLFSIISHDLKSPLTRLAGLLTLLREGTMAQKEFEMFTQELSEDVEDTAHMLNNLLVWSSTMLEGIKKKTELFDIKEVVERQLYLQSKTALKKKITCKNTIKEKTMVLADKNMVSIISERYKI